MKSLSLSRFPGLNLSLSLRESPEDRKSGRPGVRKSDTLNLNLYLSLSLLILFFFTLCIESSGQTNITSATLGMMEARHIGPAVMGGRITDIDGVPSTPRIIYISTAGGGIWKTTNAGASFKPIFDKFPQSIGALAIDPKNPNILYAGTGESNMRNSVSIGFGMFKSSDAGENWTKIGLDSTEHISKVVIHPRNSNIIFVAAPGHLWNDHKDRGLYKSTDAGKTWEKILYIDEKTGCADFMIDPMHPDTMYASTWEFRRTAYSFNSGGPGSGLYKSVDGGKTWTKITKGLPSGTYGRIAMTLAPSEPNNLLAIVESESTGLFISSDYGESWKAQSSNSNVSARPFYFSTIEVDPNNAKRVYRPAFTVSISDDGGYSFREIVNEAGWVHSDCHALWINPNNTSHMYLGTDGGVYMSLDKGNNWIFLNSIPVSQFYHVTVDEQTPYNVYGGLQDNGSWMGPTSSPNGIENKDWRDIGFGDGFWVQPDQESPTNYVYSEWQGGNVIRLNLKTNEAANIKPQAGDGETKLRFNWNSPLVVSPTNKKTLYLGAQYLYKTQNRGLTWEKISPDLTTDDKKKQEQEESGGVTIDNTSAENHCTIFSIAESPLDEKLIWVGTDDGNLQYTMDGGKNWNKVNPNISCIPSGTWVSSIEPSRFDKNTVYATFDNHAYGDMRTYAARSTDLGKSWECFSSPTFKSFAHKIKEDLVNKNLLFLGTESGLFLTIDAGKTWILYNANIPDFSLVRDIQIHARTHDLVLATHGRGILIVDDITPLRLLDQPLLQSSIKILPSRPTLNTLGRFSASFPFAGGYAGPNASEAVVINYYLKDRVTSGDVMVEIFDLQGRKIMQLPGGKRKGINKVKWNMRMMPPIVATGGDGLDFGGFVAPLLPAGIYTVKVTKGTEYADGNIELIKDPNSPHSEEDRKAQYKTQMKLYQMVEDLAFVSDQLQDQQKTSKAILAKVKNIKTLTPLINTYGKELEDIRKTLLATKESKGGITGEEQIREKLSTIYAAVAGYEGRPSEVYLQGMNTMTKEVSGAQVKLEKVYTTTLPKINKELVKEKLPALQLMKREDWEAKKMKEQGIKVVKP